MRSSSETRSLKRDKTLILVDYWEDRTEEKFGSRYLFEINTITNVDLYVESELVE